MSQRKKVLYICGPFRSPSKYVPGQQDAFGIAKNVLSAMDLGLEVWRNGAVALVPHGNTFCFQNAAPDEVWLDGDLELLRRCDAVLVTPEWSRSTGARAEVAFAISLGIPVLYSLSDALAFLERPEVA